MWSGEGLQHLLGATKRAFSAKQLIHFVLEFVASANFGTTLLFEIHHYCAEPFLEGPCISKKIHDSSKEAVCLLQCGSSASARHIQGKEWDERHILSCNS